MMVTIYLVDQHDNWMRMEIKLWIEYSWNTDSQSFVPFKKYEHTYDENGNLTLGIGYNWDTNTQSFVPVIKMNTIMMRMEIKLFI